MLPQGTAQVDNVFDSGIRCDDVRLAFTVQVANVDSVGVAFRPPEFDLLNPFPVFRIEKELVRHHNVAHQHIEFTVIVDDGHRDRLP